MPETSSIKDQIKKLIELQKLDEEIYALKDEARQLPIEIQKLSESFEAQKAKLKDLEQKLKDVLLARKEKELELKTKEDLIAKAKAALSALKTNKEYTAKLTEIENLKADLSVYEEKILISYDDGDKVNTEIEKERKILAQEEAKFQAGKKELEGQIKLKEDRVKVLESQRKQIVPSIDRAVIDRYERVLENKHGLAIVPVVHGACGGCHMNITQQMVNSLKIGAELIYCEMCTRLLYMDENR